MMIFSMQSEQRKILSMKHLNRKACVERWLSYCLSILGVAGLVSGCSRSARPGADQKKGSQGLVPVVLGKAVEKSMPVQIRSIGNVQAYSVVNIRSPSCPGCPRPVLAR